MKRITTTKSDYYEDKWENNGFVIAKLPYAFLVFKGKEVIKTFETLENAVSYTNSEPGGGNEIHGIKSQNC